MIITYLRSSSLGCWHQCQQQYYLKYVLGIQDPSNKKTLLGSACHKVFECLAHAKRLMDSNGLYPPFNVIDDSLGNVYIGNDYFVERTLSSIEIEQINQFRKKNKEYKAKTFIKDSHARSGEETIDKLCEKSFDYFCNKSEFDFTEDDLTLMKDYVWVTLEYNNGIFDPRKANIIDIERHFDFVIDEDWAKYEYEIRGKKVEGNLAIKGTMDLITSPSEGILYVNDYKTGQRIDWSTGNTKTYKYLLTDKQLMLYYYVARKLYPEYRTIIMNIFFTRDGGLFSLCYDDETFEKAEQMIKKNFMEIKNSRLPKLLSPDRSDWRCNFCKFSKDNYQNTGKSTCQFFAEQVQEYGIFDVTDKFMIGDAYNTYNAPGE